MHVVLIPGGGPSRPERRAHGGGRAALHSAGDAIVSAAGIVVARRRSAERETLLLAVEPELVRRVASEMGRAGGVDLAPRLRCRDELLRRLALDLIAEVEREALPDRVYLESLAHTLIVHLIRRHSVARIGPPSPKRGLPPNTLALVIDHIHAHLGEALTLDAIARVADISPSHFVALFKRSTGLTPHQYVVTRRIASAKALLVQTRMPIAEIASRTGFADQSHLTRLMRRQIGLTPKALRDVCSR